MDRSTIGFGVGTYIAFHFTILGTLSWLTGLGFLLPSLAPSIFLLANLPDEEMNYPQRVVGGQFIGVVSGAIAFQLLVGQPITGEPIPPHSLLGLKQVLATFFAAMLTTGGMYLSKLEHPPAYATALIISLGFVDTVAGALVFVLAVLVMTGTHEVFGKRLPIWNLPYRREF